MIFKYMKGSILEKNHLSISNVEKPLLIPVTLSNIIKFIPERRHLHVNIVGKLSFRSQTSSDIRELTRERNLMSAKNVAKCFAAGLAPH